MNQAAAQNKVAVTAGLRGASWNPHLMKEAFQTVPCPLSTEDGQKALGFLFTRGHEDKVVFLMHPREMVVTHYLVPYILEAGWACWVQGPRSIGNDLRLEHEIALYDVAAGMRQLQSLGFKKIVQLGNSGGAGLFTFYNQQALAAPATRIAHTPGGRPTGLKTATLPPADAMVFVSPHPGQGVLLMNGMDPSMVDEEDALSCNPALDPFNAANGYRRPPESSAYSAEFLGRYRQAQRERVRNIDERAQAMIAGRMDARRRLKEAPNRNDKLAASHAPIFLVWRTDADPRCWDTSIDPSERKVGSLWGADPAVSNLGSVGFGRIVTPESWLSTWSGLSSNASMSRCAGSIEQPTLFIEYTGDNCVFPADAQAIFDALRASNKSRHRVRGNHHGMPLEEGEKSGQDIAGGLLIKWLRETLI